MQSALIVLAAGGSTRLGESKQLLWYKGKSLLAGSLEAALNCGKGPVICVVSAESSKEEIAKAPFAGDKRLTLAENPHWSQGISTSIKCGLSCALKADPDLASALFMTCDQPHISADVLDELLRVFAARPADRLIVASSYDDTLGIPAVFAREHFGELNHLSGDKGAKSIILRNREKVIPVDFALGTVDIDTEEDYTNLLDNNQN